MNLVDKVDTATPRAMGARIDVDRTLNTSPMGTGPMGTNRTGTNRTDTSLMGMGIKAMVLGIKVMGNMLREEIGITVPVASLVNTNLTG